MLANSQKIFFEFSLIMDISQLQYPSFKAKYLDTVTIKQISPKANVKDSVVELFNCDKDDTAVFEEIYDKHLWGEVTYLDSIAYMFYFTSDSNYIVRTLAITTQDNNLDKLEP
ncbi:MAG: hypothetical protein MJ237_06705 [bacterium]|nr:hypothetical protein [bacterium]